MKVYNKLVRDRIPEIIEQTGKKVEYQIVEDNGKVIRLLEEKLLEEWQEYKESGSVEEIADLLEVLFAIAERKGISRDELLELARKKAEERGGFRRGVVLIGTY
ncbi:putative house-cleaning noncanonical NTP pyrophosphatase, all-alpha NTP-PPase (MazG) superfamily [Carboxydocella thermautotrophica]|nr:putative house-cleaning noncanonical NTP pyrophosphatase, all-alpha NTP-PPase (MazG) superfamily [Carboxydocella thermautotrophica]